jgi:hypothetical protein
MDISTLQKYIELYTEGHSIESKTKKGVTKELGKIFELDDDEVMEFHGGFVNTIVKFYKDEAKRDKLIKENKHLIKCRKSLEGDIRKIYDNLTAENKQLKKQNKFLQEQLDESMKENELNAEASRMKTETIRELNEKLHCDDDGFADSDWFKDKLAKHIECHLSGDGEWGSLGFKNLQEFVDAYDKLEEQTTDKKILWTKFDVFCETLINYYPSYTMDDELDFLKGETDFNHELIKQVFDEKYEDEYYYDIEEKDYKKIEEESDEE